VAPVPGVALATVGPWLPRTIFSSTASAGCTTRCAGCSPASRSTSWPPVRHPTPTRSPGWSGTW